MFPEKTAEANRMTQLSLPQYSVQSEKAISKLPLN